MIGTLEHDPFFVPSFDDTMIAARRMGAEEGRPLLLVTGIGANLAIWRRAVAPLAADRPIVSWDHRGLHDSGPPATDRLEAPAHAEDAIAVLDDLGLERVDVAAWSNGGRIALELVHRYPERVTSLALICANYGQPLRRLLRLEVSAALPVAVGVAKHFSSYLEGPFRGLASRPELAGLIRNSGFVGATADTSALVDLFKGMAACDLKILMATFEAVAGDPAPELLSDVRVPAVVIAGTRDAFSTVDMSRGLAASIPGSGFVVYEGATHYLPIEFPDRLAHDLRDFLDVR